MGRTDSVGRIWTSILEDGLARRDPATLTALGSDALVEELLALYRSFPDATWGIDWTVGDDHRMAAWFRLHGTHRGAWRGAAPSGRPISALGSLAVVVDGDRITDFRLLTDRLAILEQIEGDEQTRPTPGRRMNEGMR